MVELNKTNQDWNVSSKVKIALKVHSETENYVKSLKIGTSNGVVYLKGEVPSDEARHAIERIANSVPEVLGIVDEIVVVH